MPATAHNYDGPALTCVFLLAAYLCAAPVKGQSLPGPGIDPAADVHALIVGVTDYGNNLAQASKAAEGARRFAEVISRTYGKTAIRHLLVDGEATRDNVESALYDLQQVPRGSLVIIYFSGHGVRKTFDTGSLLYLRLHGSTPTKFTGNSIKAPDLWQALTYTKYTTGMIFLDCCYAGSDEPDIVPETMLNNANVRAFLMCACSRDETATGDVFNRALLEVWRNAHKDDAPCMTLSEFEKKVRRLVRKYDKGYMTPGLAFRTRIARCITHMNEPSALLAFSFPRGCRAGLDFFFDGKLVEEGFQYVKDRFFVCQVSLNRPIEVTVRGPEGEAIAGPFTIDPRDALPRRILTFPITVPEKYVAAPPVGPEASAIAYQRLAEMVEAYGDPPQRYYLEAARMLCIAGADTYWQRRKLAVYEPENEYLAFAAERSPLSEDTIAALAARPHAVFEFIRSLESIGARVPAGDLAWETGERVGAKFLDLKDDLLLRSYGNYKLAGTPEAIRKADRTRRILAASELNARQGLTLEAIDRLTVPQLARVWHDVPGNDAEWLAFRATRRVGTKTEVVDALVGEDHEKRNKLVEALSGLDFSELSVAEKIYCQKWEIHDMSVDVRDDRIFITDGCMFPTDVGECLLFKARVFGRIYDVLTERKWDKNRWIRHKPGFSVENDSRRYWINRVELGTCGLVNVDMVKVPGDSDFEGMAQDMQTAIEYVVKKPGFSVEYRDGVVFVTEMGDVPHWKLAHAYTENADGVLGRLKYAFPNKSVAEKYREAEPAIDEIEDEPRRPEGE